MWPRSVRATSLERTRGLPGDELIHEPILTLTHAITIRRATREVWPWLVQMGAGSRAGWYSYDIVDNGRRDSTGRIVPELQHVAVGTLFPALPGATDGFHVLEIETGCSLVLGWRPSSSAAPLMTWAFVLDTVGGCHTRLVVRARAARGYPFDGFPPSIGMPFVRFGHFVMQRKQLLGIASRAESRDPAGDSIARSEAA
jgi:hypothetical protein